MFVLTLPIPDPKTTNHSILSLQTLIPSITRKSISFNKMKKDRVDSKLSRWSDNTVHLIIFDQEWDDTLAYVAISPNNNNILFVLHSLPVIRYIYSQIYLARFIYSNRYIITITIIITSFSSSAISSPSTARIPCAPSLINATPSSSDFVPCLSLLLSTSLDLYEESSSILFATAISWPLEIISPRIQYISFWNISAKKRKITKSLAVKLKATICQYQFCSSRKSSCNLVLESTPQIQQPLSSPTHFSPPATPDCIPLSYCTTISYSPSSKLPYE